MAQCEVWVQCRGREDATLAPFGSCVVENLIPSGDKYTRVHLSFHKRSGKLLLQRQEEINPDGRQQKNEVGRDQIESDEEGLVWLSHKTPLCPAFAYSSEMQRQGAPVLSDKRLQVGVAVLVESRDGKILLTKRQERLRSFPGLFVLPGGGVDTGESLVETGLREVQEETGIAVAQFLSKPPRFCAAWESTYPLTFDPALSHAGLTHHHLVVYVHLETVLASNDPGVLKPQIAEVAELVWVSKQNASVIQDGGATLSAAGQRERIATFLPDHGEFDASNWPKQVQIGAGQKSVVTLRDLAGKTVIGTRFALGCWLRDKEHLSGL